MRKVIGGSVFESGATNILRKFRSGFFLWNLDQRQRVSLIEPEEKQVQSRSSSVSPVDFKQQNLLPNVLYMRRALLVGGNDAATGIR